MKKTLRHLTLPFLAACLLVGADRAHADLIATLDAPIQAGVPGDSLIFRGTVTNTGTDTVFLNSAFFDGLSPTLTGVDAPFYANFPDHLDGGESRTGDLFRIDITPTAAPGDYQAAWVFTGGADNTATDNLATANFTTTVRPAAVPEPGMALSLSLLCAGGLLTVKRARRHQRAVLSA